VATLVSTLQSLDGAITSSDAAKAKCAGLPELSGLVVRKHAVHAGGLRFGAQKGARGPLSAVEQATANAKRASTRTARKTMGKVQKLDVVGNVTSVVVTPVTAPTPSVSQATPPTTQGTSSTTPAAPPAASGSGSTPH
jgi:hypothetical protein